MNREEFLDRLKDTSNENLLAFTQKYIFHGTPFVFQDREEEYFEFRYKIANRFEIGFQEVFIVGSGKLGFSYHKQNTFSLDSDIDVVIVNERLFEDFFLKIADYQYQLDRQYKSITERENNDYNDFLRYLVKGWMRPDKLPTSFKIDLLKTEWFDYFESLSKGRSEVGNYDVRAGLFKNYQYLEKYYTRGIESTWRKLNITN